VDRLDGVGRINDAVMLFQIFEVIADSLPGSPPGIDYNESLSYHLSSKISNSDSAKSFLAALYTRCRPIKNSF